MSTLSVDTITKADGSGALSVPAESGTVVTTASPSLGRRNLIINGAMQVAQRGTTFDFAASNGAFTLDRFFWQNIRDDQLETRVTQDTTAPTGFASSLKVVATTAESAWGIDEFARFIYKIEAQDLQQLDYGASTAKSVTMSFWVKSDVTGTYSVSFYVPDGDRRLGSTYTINAADTWEYKTITFVGDTAGTINNDNGEGIQISFCLAAGSNYTGTDNTSWAANSDANTFYGHTASWGTTINDYWQITGVQLEVGSVATPFEHRSYGEELALCQRYYQLVTTGNMMVAGTTNIYFNPQFFCEMRSTPSISQTGVFSINNRTANRTQSSTGHTFYAGDTRGVFIDLNNFSALLTDSGVTARYLNTNAVVLDAEL